jgi:hypothetical protein
VSGLVSPIQTLAAAEPSIGVIAAEQGHDVVWPSPRRAEGCNDIESLAFQQFGVSRRSEEMQSLKRCSNFRSTMSHRKRPLPLSNPSQRQKFYFFEYILGCVYSNFEI